MRILLTGATGFIGSHLARHLGAAGHTVVGAVRDADRWQRRLPGREWRACDFTRDTRPGDWAPRLVDIDLVINAVGIITEGDGQHFETVQAQAPAALFRACSDAGLKVIQVSALGAEQRGPLPHFLASKRAADDALRELPVESVIVHPSIVIGEGGNSTALFTRLAALPLVPVPGDGHQRLNPIHIDDLCAAIAHMAAHWPGGQRRHVLTGATTLTLRELLGLLREWMGMGKARCLPVPSRLLHVAARAGEVVAPRGLLRRDTLAMLAAAATPPNDYADCPPRPLATALWSRPPGPGLRSQAIVEGVRPALLASLAFVWLFTGVVSLGSGREQGLALLASAGLTGPLALALVMAGAGADLALGAMLLASPLRRLALGLQITLMLGYMAIISVILPAAWLDPLGPVTKNLPLLAATWLLLALEPRGWRP